MPIILTILLLLPIQVLAEEQSSSQTTATKLQLSYRNPFATALLLTKRLGRSWVPASKLKSGEH